MITNAELIENVSTVTNPISKRRLMVERVGILVCTSAFVAGLGTGAVLRSQGLDKMKGRVCQKAFDKAQRNGHIKPGTRLDHIDELKGDLLADSYTCEMSVLTQQGEKVVITVPAFPHFAP